MITYEGLSYIKMFNSLSKVKLVLHVAVSSPKCFYTMTSLVKWLNTLCSQAVVCRCYVCRACSLFCQISPSLPAVASPIDCGWKLKPNFALLYILPNLPVMFTAALKVQMLASIFDPSYIWGTLVSKHRGISEVKNVYREHIMIGLCPSKIWCSLVDPTLWTAW